MTTSKPRILLIDDHSLFRSGLKFLIQSTDTFEVCDEAVNGLDGIKKMQQSQPDIVLLDLNMPVMNGLEALPLLLQIKPQTPIIMLTVSENAADLAECMRLGASGYLLKNINIDFLNSSLEHALQGDSVLSPEMTSKMLAQLRQRDPQKKTMGPDALTKREKEILHWLAMGSSNKEIAKGLQISESTIKVHVQNILKKLQLSSRVQAAIYAVEHGLV
ncbi:response regulator [Brackiella oedipodis]|uniref:response regulator n=1 Tax=Brackiella oedipodis TaxID=124225 RepID=UPI00049192F0|nr:response regulator transcription factor [Brackiella oedipodis]